jgi:GFO/IDH/MocA oxidoreductase family protein
MVGQDAGTAGRRRYAVVGLGARAGLYTRALGGAYADRAELAAFCDVNRTRMDVHNAVLASEHGHPPVPTYAAAEFAAMLARERIDVVVVCTVDSTHDRYIVAALDAGCDVITEKPMTIDADRARRILDARRRTGRSVTVAFNYRYNPAHEKVAEVLWSGAIGDIGSVHFEWLLDVRHGADYFRRWHRDRANSGGLLVHKSTHHFDLVNWWLRSAPESVYAQGRLFFYGEDNGRRRGLARPYARAHGAAAAAGDPFALHLEDSPGLRRLYLEAEEDDGYRRDQNVFGPGVTIEDDLAVLVRYLGGATMTYHLTAYSPWEGYRIAFNGSAGRLELLVQESVDTAGTEGARRLTVHPHWEPPRELPLQRLPGGHGGGDPRMLRAILGPPAPDPFGRHATELDGALSLVTGLAANLSLATGRQVRTRDVIHVPADA